MEVFATFDVYDLNGRKVAQGHKASFCLEDNLCLHGAEKKYNCKNYGDQGSVFFFLGGFFGNGETILFICLFVSFRFRYHR